MVKVPGKDEVGGSDGCLLMTDGSNAGLSDCLKKTELADVYEEVCDIVSLPDFLVIAAESLMSIQAVCEKATKHTFKYNFNF